MFVNIENKKIWYTDKGKGFPLVLIHGYLESSEIWHDFGTRLSERFRVIAVDLPGHGRSEVYGETLTMEFMAGIIKKILDQTGIRKVFLTGHSLGGYITLAFADLYADYLSGYCLFHSHPFPDSPEAAEKRRKDIKAVKAGEKDSVYPVSIERMFATSNLDKFRDEVERSKGIASSIPAGSIVAVLSGMLIRPSRVSIMEEGRVPCLWILGLLDNFIKVSDVSEKVHLPANATTVILERSGHMGFIEETDVSLRVLSQFIENKCISSLH